MVKLIQAGIARLEFHQKEVTVHLDRAKLFSEGPEAIKSLLLPMHVYLCTADREGLKMFESLSQVTEEMQKMRPWVLEKARKQKQVLQPTTVIEDGLVALHEYEATSAGVLQSWAERSL